jgi:hypothetical protein
MNNKKIPMSVISEHVELDIDNFTMNLEDKHNIKLGLFYDNKTNLVQLFIGDLSTGISIENRKISLWKSFDDFNDFIKESYKENKNTNK